MTEAHPSKKIVAKKAAEQADPEGPTWTPTPEARAKANQYRMFAWIGWIAAIGIEVAAIIWLLPAASRQLWPLLVALIPIAGLAIGANLLWRKANRLDPASRKDATRFFVQNQLGAIMTVIAFLPLIILVLLDKNIDGKQKALAGGIGAVVMILVATLTGIEWSGGPSVEQYTQESNIIVKLTGKNEVFWVKGGSVFHVCAAVPDVNRESKDGQIYTGTVAAAHEAGMTRLTERWESEALNYCGYSQAQVDAAKGAPAPTAPTPQPTNS